MAKMQTCFCCGKEYELCPHCPTGAGYAPWRTMHCCIDHFKLFELARAYKNGELTMEAARERLSRTDTAGLENFNTQTGALLREISAGGSIEPGKPETIAVKMLNDVKFNLIGEQLYE